MDAAAAAGFAVNGKHGGGIPALRSVWTGSDRIYLLRVCFRLVGENGRAPGVRGSLIPVMD
jgi:hypothetical protein